jgi:pimeloyl-ACP methyl ester carboxylesterase/predicted metal-binding membrane protein
MSLGHALEAARLVRTKKWRGFCPACRLWADDPGGAETSPPALIALAFLVLAALAWALVIWQSRSMTGMEGMDMPPPSPASFAIGWVVMMAAMMIPSALPLVHEFARRSEGRRRWRLATGVLVATYLATWLAFGLACYVVLIFVHVPPAHQGLVGGLALALGGLYGLTPIKRASEARCRELCALHGPLPFNLVRSAVVVGARYGVNCMGCSGSLMVAMVIIGMSNLAWMAVLAGLVLIYKLALRPRPRRDVVLVGGAGGARNPVRVEDSMTDDIAELEVEGMGDETHPHVLCAKRGPPGRGGRRFFAAVRLHAGILAHGYEHSRRRLPKGGAGTVFDGFDTIEIDTEETHIFVRFAGSGPPLVLLHGFPETHVMWRDVAPRLASRFTVVCADLRGYGRSGCPESGVDHAAYAKRAMARDVIAVMDRLGFSRFSVAGHDRGGRVAYRLALDHPDRVERLAVLDVVPTAEAWDRADARFALGFWPFSLLAQPEPLPERLVAGAPDAIVDHALGHWGSAGQAFGAEVRMPTLRRSAIRITCTRSARNTGPPLPWIESTMLLIVDTGAGSPALSWCSGVPGDR